MSVLDAQEAVQAAAGGAGVIDVKNPRSGPLGAASERALAEVHAAVGGRIPVTAALGELAAIPATLPASLRIVSACKAGPAGIRLSDWCTQTERLRDRLPERVELVAAAYADPASVDAPAAEEIALSAARLGLRWVLLDTADKGPGWDLFRVMDEAAVEDFVRGAQGLGLRVALGGSLRGVAVERAAAIRPDLIAVRGAACLGGRLGSVDSRLVAAVRDSIRATC